MDQSKQKYLSLFICIVFATLCLSQISSYLVVSHLDVNETHVLNSVLHLTFVRNFGGVFGMFQGNSWVFALVSTIILLSVVLYIIKSEKLAFFEYICFGFIIGGGASNIIDRIVRGYVVDFVNIQQIPYWNYVFNTADIFIHVGVWPLLLLSLFVNDKEVKSLKT